MPAADRRAGHRSPRAPRSCPASRSNSGSNRRTHCTSISTAGAESVGPSRSSSRGSPSGRTGIFAFGPQVQPFPARQQQPEPGASGESRSQYEPGVEHVLEVVDDEEHVPVGQRPDELLGCLRRADVGGAGRLQHRRSDQGWIPDVGEIHERHTVREARGCCCRHGDREPRLADAGWTGEREQPRVGSGQQPVEGRHLVVAPDERVRRRGERTTFPAGGRPAGSTVVTSPRAIPYGPPQAAPIARPWQVLAPSTNSCHQGMWYWRASRSRSRYREQF